MKPPAITDIQPKLGGLICLEVPETVAAAPAAVQHELHHALNAKVVTGLDALRALAVTLVLITHFRLVPHGPGSLGVMIFFVLSGFLITSILLKEYRRTGSISFSNFYQRRAFRIFPTFYVCWVLTTIVECIAHQFYWKPAALSFFYMMDYGRPFLSPSLVNRHMWISWSLAVEEKFYLLWPLLLLLLLKKRSVVTRMCLIILGLWTYRAILYLGFHIRWDYVYCAFDMRADALLIGCLLSILLEGERARAAFSWWVERWYLTAIPVLALLLLLHLPAGNRPLALFLWSIQPLIIAVLLVQFIYWGRKPGSIFGSRPVRFVAHISYALYLYHPLASEIVARLHLPHIGYNGAILTMIMAPASYYWIEKPFMRLRDKRGRTRRAETPAELASAEATGASDRGF